MKFKLVRVLKIKETKIVDCSLLELTKQLQENEGWEQTADAHEYELVSVEVIKRGIAE